MDICIHKYEKGDYEGRARGEKVFFQGRKLSFCNKLTAWVKYDKYLIRYYDILWFAGYTGEDFRLPDNIEYIKELFIKYIGEKDIIQLANEYDKYKISNKMRNFYGRFNNISKYDLDKISDHKINDFFTKT